MMQKRWVITFIGICCFWKVSYAVETKISRMQLPIQPYISEENDLFAFISPFEMPSWSLGVSYLAHSRNAQEVFRKKDWFSEKTPFLVEMQREIPFSDPKSALGFSMGWYNRYQYNRRRQIEDPNYVIEENSVCAEFSALEGLFLYKRKWPFYTPIGSFAGTVTGKCGLIVPFNALDTYTNTHYGPGLGGVMGGAVGCDYYFNEWLGCFFEFSLKYNGICVVPDNFTLMNIFENNYSLQLTPYGFYTTAFKFGFKTTFI